MGNKNKEQVQFKQLHSEIDCLKSIQLFSSVIAALESCKPPTGQALHGRPFKPGRQRLWLNRCSGRHILSR